MCYSFLMFVNIVTERTTRNNIGVQLVLAAAFLIALNIILLGYTIAEKVLRDARKYYRRRKIKRLLKERLQKRLAKIQE